MYKQWIASILSVLMVWQLSFPAFAQSTPAQAESTQKNAAELIKGADRAVGYVVKTARESKDAALSSSNDDSRPFWQAVKKLNEALNKVDRGLFLKDETFFTSLADATSAVEEVKITLSMSGSKDPSVQEGVEKVDAAVSLLREHYSKEAVRRKQGGELSEEERAKLNQMKEKQAELEQKLTELEGKVGKNETLIKGIQEVRNKSQQVAHSNNNVSGFLFAMTAMSVISGLIWGWHWWWGPFGAWGPGFSFGFTEIYVDTIIVVDVDYDWDLADEYVDTMDLDLEVELDDLELEQMDEYLDESDFEISDNMLEDFSSDELEFEGEMDVTDTADSEDLDVGDFSGEEDTFEEDFEVDMGDLDDEF